MAASKIQQTASAVRVAQLYMKLSSGDKSPAGYSKVPGSDKDAYKNKDGKYWYPPLHVLVSSSP